MTFQSLAAVVVVLSILTANRAQERDPLALWVASGPVALWTDEMTCANYWKTNWNVVNAGHIRISSRISAPSDENAIPAPIRLAAARASLSLPERGRIATLASETGWFVALDRGEFDGGGLWWLSEDGHAQRLIADNANKLVATGGRRFALTGVTHLELRRGKVFELTTNARGASARLIADLGTEPRALELAGNGALTVACAQGVARIAQDGRVRWLSRSDFSPVGPTSVATDRFGHVYVGMNYFVVRLTKRRGHYSERWYRPSDCAHFLLDTDTISCSCRG